MVGLSAGYAPLDPPCSAILTGAPQVGCGSSSHTDRFSQGEASGHSVLAIIAPTHQMKLEF